MKTKVLVTGANGQLGLTIKDLQEYHKETVEFTFVSKQELDITKPTELETFFKNNKFNYCINCAAYTNVEQAEKTPEIAFLVNAEGVKNLALSCKKHEIKLIHISTDYVFDGEKATPYLVSDKPNPINEYGKSKLLGEEYIQEILEQFYIVRTSWLYSKKHGKNFYKSILEKVKTIKQLSITDAQIGCPTETEELSEFLINLIKENNHCYGIYHNVGQEVMSWLSFARKILKENDLLSKVELVKDNYYRTFASRPKYSVLE